MYLKSSLRNNPKTGYPESYYRLVESYRNVHDRICHQLILNLGFVKEHLNIDQLIKVVSILNDRIKGKSNLFEELDIVVIKYVDKYWQELLESKKIDISVASIEKKKRSVEIDTIKHKDIKTVGGEWLCYQSLRQLELDKFLKGLGLEEELVQLCMTQIISRSVSPNSELATVRWIQENSAVCEITQYPIEKITKDRLYKNALLLYKHKESIEQFLGKKTNELFDLTDKIILYDLTNTYFEGRKVESEYAKFGRCKSKRNDAKLIVLAMVINVEGFIKYTDIFEGNMSDSNSLPLIIDKLRNRTSDGTKKAIVVIDAGIATEENLSIIKNKGYDFVCVGRDKIKSQSPIRNVDKKMIFTKNNNTIYLHKMENDKSDNFCLEVTSNGKKIKEESITNQFEKRFEEQLEIIKNSLTKKNQTKKNDTVQRRIGRALQKYPSVSKYYKINCVTSDKGLVTEMSWQKDIEKFSIANEQIGKYIIKTTLPITEEKTIWDIYNTIREIESSFRTLKTDLDLRPIYHKNDDATLAHLHLGLLGYWVVNTIRYQLKKHKINDSWKEIIRKTSTQNMITTIGINTFNEYVSVRKCSEPNLNVKCIYDILKYKYYPFRKIKSVVHSPQLKKNETQQYCGSPPN